MIMYVSTYNIRQLLNYIDDWAFEKTDDDLNQLNIHTRMNGYPVTSYSCYMDINIKVIIFLIIICDNEHLHTTMY